jgi:hypothetical protein
MRKNPIIRFFLFLLITCLSCLGGITAVFADTHTAASCSQTDVQAAINAAVDGDTVEIPEGTATWTSPVTCSNKEITIKGAGMTRTIITDGTSVSQMPLVITGQEGKPFRITELCFFDTMNSETMDAAIDVYGTCKNWRIDHCRFEDLAAAIRIGGNAGNAFTYGLIDRCTFYFHKDVNGVESAIFVGCDNEPAWDRPLTLGTSNAVYVEDCYFNFINPASNSGNTNAIHAEHGARVVFRHNRLNTKIEIFGSCTAGTRGAVSCEIYNNELFGEGVRIVWVAMGIQGGTGVVFNNTIVNAIYSVNPFILYEYRSCDYDNCWGSVLNVRCDGTSLLDGNLPGMMGWPCRDQVGRGPQTEVVSEQTVQRSEPVYEWNNTFNGANLNFTLHDEGNCTTQPYITDHIKDGRDYYTDTVRTDYTPYQYPHPLALSDINDTTPPSQIAQVRDGTTGSDIDLTYSTTTLSANWDASTDTESNIARYMYAIGTAQGGTDVVGWTDNGIPRNITKTGLTLEIGTIYYFTVVAVNGVSLESNPANSDGQSVTTGGGATDELDIKVYPNPFILSEGSQITFSINEPSGGEVRIYTISGKLVKELAIESGESGVDWDVLNEDGNSITTGLYLYTIIDGDGGKKTGKITITR